jgi:hypothetical protein
MCRVINILVPRLLVALPTASRVRLARKSSVCLYVETKAVLDEPKIRHEMHCDEFDLLPSFRRGAHLPVVVGLKTDGRDMGVAHASIGCRVAIPNGRSGTHPVLSINRSAA